MITPRLMETVPIILIAQKKKPPERFAAVSVLEIH